MTVSTSIQSAIQQKLYQHFTNVQNLQFTSVGGGCINDCFRLSFSNYRLFCKINSASKFPHLFEKERHGLELIQQQNVIRVPKVIDCFEIENNQVLILEWMEEGERTENFWEKFGEQLAALHKVSSEQFGLDEDNYMGSVPQRNKKTEMWGEFFIQQRLQPLVKQCLDKHLLSTKHVKQFDKLYSVVPTVFDKNDRPSLLHGDLWSGNFMCNEYSEPVLIDTAVYFGHSSLDLAMTTLFGGFRSDFYESYNYHLPFPSNHKEQWQMCNLYPLLIHLLLFGGSYLGQIETILSYFS